MHWKSVWITGATHGLGRALTEALATGGTRVAASARGVADLQALAGSLSTVLAVPLDVTDAEANAQAVARIEADQGPLDLVILNAGVYEPIPGGIASPEVFRRHMEVNYLGVVNGLMAVLPRMRARGAGTVALVASVAGYRGLPQAAAYGPTKAALINLAECLRLDLADSGVDVRLVNPGFVSTRLTAKNDFAMPGLLTPEDAARRLLAGLESRRFEIAFPSSFVAALKLARHLPYWLYFRIAAKVTRRRGEAAP